MDVQYIKKKTLYHSYTRWLSLFPCLNRILEVYEGLISHFLPKSVTPFVVKKCLKMVKLKPGNFSMTILRAFRMKKEENSFLEIMDCLNYVENCLEGRIYLPKYGNKEEN